MNDRVHMKKTSWRYIVVDEGHRLKNSNCRLIKELKMYTSANRLLLTGTPLQNNLDELWSLLNFLMAEIFDDLRVFRSWFNAKNLDTESEDEKQRYVKHISSINFFIYFLCLYDLFQDFAARAPKQHFEYFASNSHSLPFETCQSRRRPGYPSQEGVVGLLPNDQNPT